ncbi:MAG TPA: sortase [Anaerolineaceae bacterium]
MPRSISADDLTVDQLRRLLVEKRRAQRQERLENYRRTGRVIQVEPGPAPASLDHFYTQVETSEPNLTQKKSGPRILDRLLLFVEIIAVIGLGYVLYSGFNMLTNLNREALAAQKQPTLTPTPVISAVILPSGHTPPTDPGGVRFNDAEIPSHLRPLVQSLANLPTPTASPEQVVRLRIPAINVDAPVVLGDGWEQLKKGVGQHIGSGLPGKKGNLILSAHNDIFGEIFRELDKLKTGDQVIVYTQQRAYTYQVRQTQIVEPTRVEVMAPTSEAVVTLISCYPYLVDNQRIVVSAVYQDQK